MIDPKRQTVMNGSYAAWAKSLPARYLENHGKAAAWH